jgi:chromosome partitioning protein
VTLKIVVMNPKGGSGKTTVAMNLAAFYASDGKRPAIMDLDSQASSTRWLAKRSLEIPPIHGVSPFNIPAKVTRSFAMRIPNEVERIIVDTPAALNKQQFAEVTGGADRILVPVLPSDIDIQAATRCIADLLLTGKVQRSDNRLAVIANRVKRNTVIFRSLMRFLEALKIPVVAVLRDSQNYIRAAETGIGLHEMKGARFRTDQKHWATLIEWIEHGTVPPATMLWSDDRATTPAKTEATDEVVLKRVDVSRFINKMS